MCFEPRNFRGHYTEETMAKAIKEVRVFSCNACGADHPKWLGKCPSCGGWNTLEEKARVKTRTNAPRRDVKAQPITAVESFDLPRLSSGGSEFDRVVGGGFVHGSLVLIGGEPGVGKSTLLLQSAARIAREGKKVLYVSAEESLGQTKMRAERLDALSDNLLLLSETDLGVVMREIDRVRPTMVVLDSVQTLCAAELDSAPGSVSQVREVCTRVMRLAKTEGITTLLVGHVTKEGSLAGPRTLEHMVDTVLWFEGGRNGPHRLLRAHKNRFGSTHEIAVFEMRGEGLEEVKNPSAFFLAERQKDAPGSVVSAAMEGTRPLLVEVQGLCVQSAFGNPRRTTVGVDSTRCAVLAAVLERRCGLSLSGHDLFVNVAGGASLSEPAADLSIALAVASSLRNRAVDPELVCFGEVGLAGEIRGVQRAEARVQEAFKLGFSKIILPSTGLEKLPIPEGVMAMGVKNIGEALEAALDS